MRRLRTIALAALILVVLAVGGLTAVHAADMRRRQGEVARNVELLGRDVSGLRREQVARVVAELAPRLADRKVRVQLPEVSFTLAGAEVGLQVDQERTVADVLAVGRRGTLPSRVWGWTAGLFGDRQAPVRVEVGAEAVARLVAQRDPGPRLEPVDPTIALEDGHFVAVPGRTGRGVDPADVVAAVRAADARHPTVTVDVVPGRIPPRAPDAEAERLAAAAEPLGRRGLAVTVGGQLLKFSGSSVRPWLTTKRVGHRLELTVDVAQASAAIRRRIPDAGTPPTDATFAVREGRLHLVPARPGRRCCAPEMADRVVEALRGAEATIVDLPLEAVAPDRTDAEARDLGIVEEVGTFTTRHKAGEARVTNIHRIADLVRGHIIEPGTTFSVNDFVGRRTREKGFVPAGVIENGVFGEGVGGGVSQFATTLFNAAFFAGLDYGEYQSHSIYISRYPRGREATLSYPRPDLEIENRTPYGVLVWTSYTSTSITVTLYSTKHVEAEQTNQTTGARGACEVVVTERTRRWLDTGKTETDKVRAVYRPAEGVNC